MSDNEVTGATARPWRFVPSHVAEGPSEVRSPEGWLICTTSSDADAALIERAVNAYEPLKARLAEVEREAVARAICQSGKFETGEGTCALLCMDQLGSPRKKGCCHSARVHGKLADAILSLLRPTEPVEAEGVGEPKPAGWQRSLRYANVPVWEQCSTSEATSQFDRSPYYDYRPIYTHPPKSPEMIELLKLAYDNMFDGEAREQVRRKLFE